MAVSVFVPFLVAPTTPVSNPNSTLKKNPHSVSSKVAGNLRAI